MLENGNNCGWQTLFTHPKLMRSYYHKDYKIHSRDQRIAEIKQVLHIREPGQTVDHSKASRMYHSLLNPLKSTISAINQSIDLGSTEQSKWGHEITQEDEKPASKKRTLGGSVHLKMRLRESVGFHNQVALSKQDRLGSSSLGSHSLQEGGLSAKQTAQVSTA